MKFFIKSQLVALLMGRKKKSVISIFVDDDVSNTFLIVHHGTIVNDAVCDLLLHSCKKWVECKKWKLD